jgi:hypothetical protein
MGPGKPPAALAAPFEGTKRLLAARGRRPAPFAPRSRGVRARLHPPRLLASPLQRRGRMSRPGRTPGG